MIAEILDEGGNVLNRIVGEREFLDAAYPGAWRAWIDPQALANAKVAKSAAVDARRDALLDGGFVVPASVSATLGGQVLQTRNADDKINWKLSRDAYREAATAGHGDALAAAFRTASNATITVAVSEGQAVLDAMQAWGTAVLRRSWTLKDAITAAPDAAALDAIDITAGWPG